MPNERKQAATPEIETPVIELKDFKGLSLKPDVANRPPMSWRRLDNFDLYVPGSIRKVQSAQLINGPFPAEIISLAEFKATDAGPFRLYGIGTNGRIYDMGTANAPGAPGIDLGVGPIGSPVFTCLLPGTYIGLADPGTFTAWLPSTAYTAGGLTSTVLGRGSDGQLYCFKVVGTGITAATWPIWPIALNSTVVDGTVTWQNVGIITGQRFVQNYLVVLVPGQQSIKFDGTNVTQVGVSAPTVALLTGAHQSANLNGLVLTTGRYYSWTFWNPKTLHESAPAPIQGPTTRVDGTANPGSFVGPSTAGTHSYDSILLQIPTGALTPAIGQGYTHIRFYATKDGGSQLYLIQSIYHDTGTGTYIESDPNGAVPIALMASGIGGLFSPPQVGGSVMITQVADGNLSLPAPPASDMQLNFPAPAFTDNYPPPVARWGTVFQGSLIVQDDISANLLWPSDSGLFESFGQFNSINILNENDDDIVAFAGGFNQLIVSTKRRVDSIIGDVTNIASLVRSPVDSLHGFLGKRAMFPLGSSIVGLMRQGFAILSLSMSFGATSGNVQLGYGNDSLIGDDILPITQSIMLGNLLALPCIAVDNTQNILLFAITSGNDSNDIVLMYSLGANPGWSQYVPAADLPTIKEVVFPDGSIGIGATDTVGNFYKLFAGGAGVPVAVAETQALPVPSQMGADLWDTDRNFLYFYIEGQDLANFTYQWATDYPNNSNFTPPTPLPLKPGMNKLGAGGKQIVLRFIHSMVPTKVPLISYIKVAYTLSGRTS